MAKKNTKRAVYVYADWCELNGPVFMGVLHAELSQIRAKDFDDYLSDKHSKE